MREENHDPSLAIPEAILVIGTGCPHCGQVTEHLVDLVKEGSLGLLTIIQAAAQPERVQGMGVKSVPWMRIGPFVLVGKQKQETLRHWIAQTRNPLGMAVYFDSLFSTGQRRQVEEMIREDPALLVALVALLGDPEVGINTRLGVGVVLEELAASDLNRRITHAMGRLTRHPEARIRGDAAHYLPLTGDPAALDYLRVCLSDANPDVREIAEEAMETLQAMANE